MSTTVVKTITLRNDDTLIDEDNQEIPVESIIHCLGALFKVTNSGLSHVEKLMLILISLTPGISVK